MLIAAFGCNLYTNHSALLSAVDAIKYISRLSAKVHLAVEVGDHTFGQDDRCTMSGMGGHLLVTLDIVLLPQAHAVGEYVHDEPITQDAHPCAVDDTLLI